MKKLTWAQAVGKMLEGYPDGNIPDGFCPGLSCSNGCPFYIEKTKSTHHSCEMTHELKGQNAYKIAIARAVGEKLDLI